MDAQTHRSGGRRRIAYFKSGQAGIGTAWLMPLSKLRTLFGSAMGSMRFGFTALISFKGMAHVFAAVGLAAGVNSFGVNFFTKSAARNAHKIGIIMMAF